jgi:MoaA/NifB/PqqE/SkfB family radical SAM enzyme
MPSPIQTAISFIRKVNPRAHFNAFRGYCEGLLRLARPLSSPTILDIILTKVCNLRCTFCISYGSLKGDRWMDFPLYERIARQLFPQAHSLFLCSGGEPLMYHRLRDALLLAQHYRVLTFLASNGTLLNRDTAQWLTDDQSLHELWISFDGARKETLERIRRGANYDLILDNIEYLSALKKKRGLHFPRLAFRYVAMRSNAAELPEIFKLCARHGVSQVKVKYLEVANDLEADESLFHHRQLAGEVFAAARRRASEWGISLHLPRLPGRDNHHHRCLYPWQFCQIDADGSIRFCYRAWRQRLGFFDDGFDSIWLGENYQKIRRSLDSDAPFFPYCQYCSSRRGVNWESSHNKNLHTDAYIIPGLESLQIPFNQRIEENISSGRARKAVK